MKLNFFLCKTNYGFYMKEINLKIKQLRELKSYTQEYMADKLNVSNSTYSRIETGQQDITISRLAEIAAVLDVETWELLAPDGNKRAETGNDDPVEAVLQIKLRQNKRDQVLRLVFGDNDLEILNK